MTDITSDSTLADPRSHRRFVRLDTILRLRWLAVLGQIAAIAVVAQGLEFDVPVVPCLVVIALSAAVNLVLQSMRDPRRRLEPEFAGALLALNIVELAALLFLTGRIRFHFFSWRRC
jgi:two-component system, sensor histidine kinase RegB